MALEVAFARSRLAHGTRGPSMAFLYRHGSGQPIGCGGIFFHECPGGMGVVTMQDALDYVAGNLAWINSQLAQSQGPGLDTATPVGHGWKKRMTPAQIQRADEVEAIMVARAKTFVGWE